MGRADGVPPALFPLRVSMSPSRAARYLRWSVGVLLWVLACWLVHLRPLGWGMIEPFSYLALLVFALAGTRKERPPAQLLVDAGGNVFVELDGRSWRLTPEAIEACYAGWIHIRGRAWSDAPLDARKPAGPPRRIAFTIWRDSVTQREWQCLRATVAWLEQRDEPLLGALTARDTKA